MSHVLAALKALTQAIKDNNEQIIIGATARTMTGPLPEFSSMSSLKTLLE